MSALAEIERFLERLFERTSARIFRTRVRPIQLQRRVERAMELGRVPGSERTIVPDRFRVRLHPSDVTALTEDDGGPAGVAERVADNALAYARAHGFTVLERPSISIVADPAVETGSIEVDAGFGGRRVDGHDGGRPGADAEAAALAPARANAGSAGQERPHTAAAGVPSATADPTRTMVYRRPIVAGPRAVLRVVDRTGAERTLEVDGSLITIGRARDNALVVDDPRISRYHARLQARRGALVFTDLGSTNGSRVNGLVVDEIVLGLGDRIELGDTTLVVESLPG